MHIWVDADACPLVIKEILFRTAERLRIPLTLVANRKLRTPASSYIQSIRVEQGLDMADRHIVLHARPNDLVVTADIPLAAEVIARGGYALNPRGILYSRDNISYHLVTRDLPEQMRDADGDDRKPSLLSQAERQDFANQLDRFLTRQTD